MKILTNPKIHIIFLMLLMLAICCFWIPQQMDDGSSYQQFSEKIVNEGKIDLSMPGFHGGDFLVVIMYLITNSEYSVYIVDLIAALLIIPLIYLLVKEMFGKDFLAVLATYIYVLMPFDFFNFFRGGHQTLHFFTVFLALYLLFKNKKYSWIVLGIAYITRPLAILAAPFYVYKKKFKQLLLSFIFPIVYIGAQYWQVGRIIMGQHTDLTPQQFFDPGRFLINIIYGIQNYFSIHNFSPVSHSYPTDLIRISPILTVLAVIAVLYYKKFPELSGNNKKLFYTLVVFAVLSYLLPCTFFWMDMNYFGLFNFGVIFLALPVIFKFKRLIPIIVFTSFYQFFYFLIGYKQFLNYPDILFLIPFIVLVISLLYTYYDYQQERMSV